MTDTLFEFYNVNDDNFGAIYDVSWRAQVFTVGNVGANINHTITSIKVLLYRIGDPPGIVAHIEGVVDNKPDGDILTSGESEGGTLTENTAGEWREIILEPLLLTAGMKYAIVLNVVDGNYSNKVVWRKDGSSALYGGGCYAFSSDSGSSWFLDTDDDYMFEEYGIGAVVVVPRPTAAVGNPLMF